MELVGNAGAGGGSRTRDLLITKCLQDQPIDTHDDLSARDHDDDHLASTLLDRGDAGWSGSSAVARFCPHCGSPVTPTEGVLGRLPQQPAPQHATEQPRLSSGAATVEPEVSS